MTRCGFVALVGAPNAGKSSLINLLVGEKISIISPKVQTTRQEVRGIVEYATSQVIYIDTPGIFKPETALEHLLVKNRRRALRGADVILVLIDASLNSIQRNYRYIRDIHNKYPDQPISVILNKIDLIVHKEKLLGIAAELRQFEFLDEIFMVSALTGEGVEPITDYVSRAVPDGPWVFPSGHGATDSDEAYRLSEITREKVYEYLEQELPYNIYVQNDLLHVSDRKIELLQSIVVKKESQKKIVIGRGGAMIRAIKLSAIREMRDIFKKKIALRLNVLTRPRWEL